jgi:hypothetical protein
MAVSGTPSGSGRGWFAHFTAGNPVDAGIVAHDEEMGRESFVFDLLIWSGFKVYATAKESTAGVA